MEYQKLMVVYRGYDIASEKDGSFTISKNGAPIAIAQSEDAAMTAVDALRRAQAKGAA